MLNAIWNWLVNRNKKDRLVLINTCGETMTIELPSNWERDIFWEKTDDGIMYEFVAKCRGINMVSLAEVRDFHVIGDEFRIISSWDRDW